MNLFGEFTEYSRSVQKNFVKEVNKFIKFKPQQDAKLNSVDFDLQQFMESTFPAITMNNAGIDIDEVYNKNFDLLSSQIHDTSFNDFIDEHLELKLLVYFLKDEYVNDIKKQFEENNDRNKTNNLASTLVTPIADTDPTLSKAVVHPNKPEVKTNQHPYNRPQTRSAIEKAKLPRATMVKPMKS
ncbi:hypothetical protein KQ941_16630 [Paenibacillus xylanexedens]|uniref:hypothetical protein n=1 Tax=Paenibacillus xylanexedens TaxID=528191 RepID=UPI001F353E16|nr:hypothetical protein [Paenibacillus xylanexedens]MCF7756067.1 hypothetical protein [Paenibacillus xylanexedens]